MTAMKWFMGYVKKQLGKMILGLTVTTMIAVLSIVAPQIRGAVLDDVIQAGNYDLLPKLVLLLLGVTIAVNVLRFVHLQIYERASQKVLFEIRNDVYRKFMEEDLAFYNKRRTGDLMSRQTGDLDAIRHFLAQVIYIIYQNALQFLFALGMIFMVNYKLALCMLAVLPLTAYNTYAQSKKIKPAFKRNRECFSSLNTAVQENISGNRVVKAFAKEDYEIEKFNIENDKYREAQLYSSKIWRRYLPLYDIFSNLLLVILMVFGGYLVIQGEITLGDAVTVYGYLWMLNSPLRMAGWWVNDVLNFITSLEKVYETYSAEPNIKTPGIDDSSKQHRGAVEFKNVSYSTVDASVEIIKDISFKAEAGQTVGIIGSTGSGKTTIMNLLCRFFDPTKGEVLVDGVNVKDLDLYKLRDNIGMAMQDVFLFSDTIEGNIAYGRPDCTFEEVRQAAIKADANHFIKELPDGYDTIVGERGVGLSGGQKQRISLARALLKNPSILILDDTTSAVDMETESYIQKQLKAIDKSCTKFIIAYRISSIKDADLILVMDQGRIIEQGNHDSLVAQGGYYAQAFKNQYGEVPYDLLEEERQRASKGEYDHGKKYLR